MVLKICGITNLDDAISAVESGANALGFNFYPASPRYITPQRTAEIMAQIPVHVWKAGVFVNDPRAAETATALGLDIMQLHGDAAAETRPGSGFRIWKAVQVRNGFDLRDHEDPAIEALLLDGPAGALYGGSGKVFDWNLARGSRNKIVIAGGLDASNVARAIELARPWGVDACSRLESAPGRKDHRKMAAFLKAALSELHP